MTSDPDVERVPKWKRWVVGAAFIVLVEYPIASMLVQKTDAFAEAERFVRENTVVREYVGNVRGVTPSWFGFSINDWGDGGAAQFDLKVSGDLRDTEVDTELAKTSGWQVSSAKLLRENEPPIQLR